MLAHDLVVEQRDLHANGLAIGASFKLAVKIVLLLQHVDSIEGHICLGGLRLRFVDGVEREYIFIFLHLAGRLSDYAAIDGRQG